MDRRKPNSTRKRGRKSKEDIAEQMGLALRHIEDLEYLELSNFKALRGVQYLAKSKYQSTLFPVGFAVRALLEVSVHAVCHEFDQIPGYEREVRFLRMCDRGINVTHISRTLGLSREYVSRTVRPRVLALVARRFLAWANDDHLDQVIDLVEQRSNTTERPCVLNDSRVASGDINL